MTIMVKLTLDGELADFVTGTVGREGFASEAAYLEALVRRDMAWRDEIANALQDGEDSGVSDKTMDEILAEARRSAAGAVNG